MLMKRHNTEKYFKRQLSSEEFMRSFLEEKVKLDLEYKLEELKKDIKSRKSRENLIKKIDSIEQYVMSA